MRRRLVLVGPVFAATLLLAGCDDALDGTGYGEGESQDITPPEAPGDEPPAEPVKDGCHPGSALAECQQGG